MDLSASEPIAERCLDVGELFRLHADDVFAYAARRVGREVANEVTANTFKIAFERGESFDPTLGGPRPWLFGIASNVIRGHWRSERRHLRALARSAKRVAPVSDSQDEIADRVDAQRHIAQVLVELARLPVEDREAMTLFAWEGLSYSEIAIALDIPIGTVRSRLHRIRKVIQLQKGTDS